MIWRAPIFALAALTASPVLAGPVKVPSGIAVTLHEVLLDEIMSEQWVRFRFIAPRLGSGAGQVSFDVAAIDMDYLCDATAVPYVRDHALNPARIVISLADRVVPFGDRDPAATQFFGAYRLEDGRCIWEEF